LGWRNRSVSFSHAHQRIASKRLAARSIRLLNVRWRSAPSDASNSCRKGRDSCAVQNRTLTVTALGSSVTKGFCNSVLD